MSRRLLAGLLLVVTTGLAHAHSETPDDVVAALGDASTRARMGVEKVERDGANPRVLVLRVGKAWYEHSEDERREAAARWRERWQQAVPQGVVAVLDAKTEQPVVRFAPGGRVFLAPGGSMLMPMQPR